MLNIVTPTTRPWFLPTINKNLQELDISATWWVIYDYSMSIKPRLYEASTLKIVEIQSERTALGGHVHRNHALELIKDGWIYFLDDDNILPKRFPEVLGFLDGYEVIVVDQIDKNGKLLRRAAPSNVKVGHIDTGQFLCTRKVISDFRFDETRYDADGMLLEQLYMLNKDFFRFVNQPYSYYNYLQ